MRFVVKPGTFGLADRASSAVSAPATRSSNAPAAVTEYRQRDIVTTIVTDENLSVDQTEVAVTGGPRVPGDLRRSLDPS
jgi:hypothetical protein